jgi:hypothetical protein
MLPAALFVFLLIVIIVVIYLKTPAAKGHISERAVARRLKEPLKKSAAALSGSFAPTFRFENLEIHKVFLQFSNLNLEQNSSLTALAI